VLNHQILPILGGYRLQDIGPMQIQALMAGLAGKSNSLQSKVLIHLRSIFTAAMENGLVSKSPVSSMLKPSGNRTEEKVALTPEESALLLDKVKDVRARTFLLIALHTGMRRGEIIGLLWEDIDFEKKVIHVRHNAIIKEKATTISSDLKTKAGKRDIPLSEELEQWLTDRERNTHSKYVFAMKNHKPMTLSSYKSMWRHIEKELPDAHVSAHILRHTYITRMFEAGLDIKEVQYLAGHSTVDMTLRVYTHYDQRSRTKESADSGFCKAGLGISFAEVSCGLFNSSGSYHKMHLITGKNRCGHRENAPWFVIQRASSFDSLIIPQRIVPLQYPFM